jgi:hypothetical protein
MIRGINGAYYVLTAAEACVEGPRELVNMSAVSTE